MRVSQFFKIWSSLCCSKLLLEASQQRTTNCRSNVDNVIHSSKERRDEKMCISISDVRYFKFYPFLPYSIITVKLSMAWFWMPYWLEALRLTLTIQIMLFLRLEFHPFIVPFQLKHDFRSWRTTFLCNIPLKKLFDNVRTLFFALHLRNECSALHLCSVIFCV